MRSHDKSDSGHSRPGQGGEFGHLQRDECSPLQEDGSGSPRRDESGPPQADCMTAGPSWSADLPGRRVIGAYIQDTAQERVRIWEVRRYCQVKPALVSCNDVFSTVADDEGAGDYALTAILRCLLLALNADIAFISLLDDTTQYFVAGAARPRQPENARSPLESNQWYGCDAVLHAGGLCNRTIRLTGTNSLYEEFDMSTQEYTRSLPFVNGEIASFRYYAGVPITSPEGHAIGTAFVMANSPRNSGLSPHQHAFLSDSAMQIMKQLEQAVQALEGERISAFNAAVTSLARIAPTPGTTSSSSLPSAAARLTAPEAAMQLHHFYGHAAELLLNGFEFGAVFLQEVKLSGATNAPKDHGSDRRAEFLALAKSPDTGDPSAMQATPTHVICEHWPEGEIFNRIVDSDGPVMISSHTPTSDRSSSQYRVGKYLAQTYIDAEQLLIMPMWDPLYDRVTALAVGVARSYGRVYTRSQDLFPISAFCASIMNHAHRMEARHREQRKSDFLGTMSHEMLSPLHGTLANVELALETASSDEQRSMLHTALTSGRQLLSSIDKVLAYAQISADPETSEASVASARHLRSPQNPSISPHAAPESTSTPSATLRTNTEEAVLRAVARTDRTLESTRGSNVDNSFRQPVSIQVMQTEGSHAQSRHWQTGLNCRRGSREPSIEPIETGLTVVMDATDTFASQAVDTKALTSVIDELVTNALNYTPRGCLRISLLSKTAASTNSQGLLLSVEDSGKGIRDDFLKHRLFVPFSQDDRVDSGSGLGLSLVKQTVDSLGGEVSIESVVGTGTAVSVYLPVNATDGFNNFAALSAPDQDSQRLARFYAPVRSRSKAAQKTYDMMYSSLSRTLQEHCNIQLMPWDPTQRPDLVVVTDSELEELMREQHRSTDCPRLVLCSSRTPPLSDAAGDGSDVEASVTSPILPSHVIAATRKLLNPPKSGTATTLIAENYSPMQKEALPNHIDRATSLTTAGLDAAKASLEGSGGKMVATQEHIQSRSDAPSLLLVDDNLINLRILAKYAKRCGVKHAKMASGGQEAIDEFRLAFDEGRGKFPYDLVFMDLSMPGISGFDATLAIRELERHVHASEGESKPHKIAIIALSGLVSAKDRKAAFDAGVDQYITKPANMESIEGAIRFWKQAHTRAANDPT